MIDKKRVYVDEMSKQVPALRQQHPLHSGIWILLAAIFAAAPLFLVQTDA